MTLTTLERDTARAGLDMDERIARNAEIAEYLDQLATAVAKLRRTADAVPTDYASTFLALELVEVAGRMNKPRGQVAEIVHLLGCVQDAAVRQARTHGASWEAIGLRSGEAKGNLHARFSNSK